MEAGRYLAAPILAVLLVVLAVDVFGATSQNIYFSPEDLSCEVLLNRDNIFMDASILDGMVEDGTAKVLDIGPAEGEEAGAGGLDQNHIYVLRSLYDERLAVVIQAVNDTHLIEDVSADADLEGVSITLTIPSSVEEVDVKVESRHTAVSVPDYLIMDLSGFLRGLGYTLNTFSPPVTGYADVSYIKGSVKIGMEFNGSLSGNGSQMDLNIFVEGVEGSINRAVEGDMRSIMTFFGIGTEAWDRAEGRMASYKVKALVPYEGVDPASIPWKDALRTDLERLVRDGIVSGLGSEDIIDISSLAAPGRTGPNRRIVSATLLGGSAEPGWYPYSGTMLPQIFDEEGSGGTFISSGDLPAPTGEGPWEFPAMTAFLTGAGILCALVLSGFLYHRIRTGSLMDNVNRKLIFEMVKANPGIHFRELLRKLDLKQGVLSYHLNRMEKEEVVKSLQDGIFRRFYIYDQKVEFKIFLSSIQRMIVQIIGEQPGVTQVRISQLTGKNRVLINYHIRFLKDAGIVFLEKEGRESKCYLSQAPAIFQ